MSSFSYSIGKLVGSNRLLTVVVLASMLGTGIYVDKRSAETRKIEAERTAAEAAKADAKRRADAAAAEAKRQEQLTEACKASGEKMNLAASEMKAGRAQRAFEALQDCRANLADPLVKALYLKAMTAAREQQAADAKRLELAEKAEKKKHGVRIGMTQQDVLDSSWGRPEHINRTTTAHGTREQWVYGLRSYLYFDDGILTAIQN